MGLLYPKGPVFDSRSTVSDRSSRRAAKRGKLHTSIWARPRTERFLTSPVNGARVHFGGNRRLQFGTPRNRGGNKFTDWAPGEVLRHAEFVALRDDKDPQEVVREELV